jgi:hypothetical protein
MGPDGINLNIIQCLFNIFWRSESVKIIALCLDNILQINEMVGADIEDLV